jgi:hypothetical protein
MDCKGVTALDRGNELFSYYAADVIVALGIILVSARESQISYYSVKTYFCASFFNNPPIPLWYGGLGRGFAAPR